MSNALKKEKVAVAVPETQESENISDIYIPVKKFSTDTSKGTLISKEHIDNAWFYAKGCKKTQQVKSHTVAKDFTLALIDSLNSYSTAGDFSDDKVNDIQVVVECNGTKSFCRVHKEKGTSFGTTVVCRIQPELPPDLKEMAMPFMMYDLLMHPLHEKGGLIILVAGLGAGKTTTVSATVRSRLSQYGGLAVSIEDPPEHNLMGNNNGFWGDGKIIQKAVMSSNGESFAEAVRNSLRMFPATPGNLLFLGEIRDSDTAEHALNAAANGSLVMATVHGNDVASGLDRFLSYTVSTLGKELSYVMLRDSLRLSIFQGLDKLEDKAGEGEWGGATPRVTMLHNLPWGGKLKGEIASGFNPDDGIKKGLGDVTDTQKALVKMGAKILNTAVKGILKGGSPEQIVMVLSKLAEKESYDVTLTENDLIACCKYVRENKISDKVKTRLLRSEIQWQTMYEPKPFIDLRSKVVSAVLTNYYKGD